jgi:anti-sigma regulatory factor (Ser/Thr protein kinase)
MKFGSDPKMLCVVRAALGQLTEQMGFSAEESRGVVLAVDEALANVIRHAYGGEPDRPIDVSFSRVKVQEENVTREGLEIVLADEGVPLKDVELRGRSLDEVRPGGLGLHLIRQNMHKVEFRYDGGKNNLRLVKFLAPEGGKKV